MQSFGIVRLSRWIRTLHLLVEGLGIAYVMKGEYEKAVKEIEILRTLDNDEVGYLFLNGITYCKWGKEKKAHRNLKEILDQSQKEFVSPLDIAAFHACLGEKDQAFEWLEKFLSRTICTSCKFKDCICF
jgi:tetratricopeptide (TPR) repeat protein